MNEQEDAVKVREFPANTDSFKWVVLNNRAAKKLNISLIKIDGERAVISIDLAYIPCGMTVLDYLEFLETSGIIMNLSAKGKDLVTVKTDKKEKKRGH